MEEIAPLLAVIALLILPPIYFFLFRKYLKRKVYIIISPNSLSLSIITFIYINQKKFGNGEKVKFNRRLHDGLFLFSFFTCSGVIINTSLLNFTFLFLLISYGLVIRVKSIEPEVIL